MKKIFLFLIGSLVLSMSACSDMLEVESDRMLIEPDINKATDSLFYVLGIKQAMQQAADQYVLQNEMRGDLVSTTSYSSKDLQALANFTADASNKYDSAYVFYRVINNCNYYLAHRDTTLKEGSLDITENEYAAVLSFRAWAYLQLAKQYGKAKFYTEPLTSISQIENEDFPEYGIADMVNALVPTMEKYAGTKVPSTTGTSEYYIPIDVMLGEMYLEAGEWAKAAKYYYNYLYNNAELAQEVHSRVETNTQEAYESLPKDFSNNATSNWRITTGGISVIDMATSKRNGVTTDLSKLFGYNPISLSRETDSIYLTEIQIVPSAAYTALADSSWYYYVSNLTDLSGADKYKRFKGGDGRRWNRVLAHHSGDSITYYPSTYGGSVIHLYRASTVWLHLAEALNRMGYPDAAFAILKDGITDNLQSDTTYISDATKQLFSGADLPFFSANAKTVFYPTTSERNYGIHAYGCSDNDGLTGTFSKYQFGTVVGEKLNELVEKYGITLTGEKSDTILAVEDLLCDEYAMEFAFEGTRFSDLMRLARNKNTVSTYGANFGNIWLSKKYESRGLSALLLDENNWYLPFK